MKKIGFCINALEMGGAEKLLVDIVKALYTTNRYEIHLLTKNESNSDFYREIKDKIKYSYLISKDKELKNKRFGKLSGLISSIQKKRSFKKFEKEIDVVIDFLDGDFYKYIKDVKLKEKILWLHLNYKELQLNKKIDKKICIYNKTIVTTEEMHRELVDKKDVKKLSMLYNLIDFEKIDDFLKEEIKCEENLELEQEFFLTVCRLNEEQKDVKTLLKAFSKYKGPELLYIIGDGPDMKELVTLSENLNLKERVKFLGTKYNPYHYMEKAKIFILSTKFEGFGLVVAEALYCGTKVISSDCDYGPREILLNGEVGELFSVGDSDELLKKIEISLERKYSQDKIDMSLKRFRREEILKRLEDIINAE